MTVKVKTTCGVAVPNWYINAENLGKCRKYQPHRLKGTGQNFMLCSETKLPCPLNGEHQFYRDVPKLPDWMKKVKYHVEPED